MEESLMSLPAVGPSCSTLEKFWKRVAEVTTRHHDPEHGWVGGEEIRMWNEANTQCRHNKVGCDRKPRFVFDMTKDRFFTSYPHFLRIFQDPDTKQVRRLRRHEYKFKPVASTAYSSEDSNGMQDQLEIAYRNMRAIQHIVRRSMHERDSQ
ncbi:hypothetical protein C8R47DRAFT_1080232 [Mycena vitilis]|nr:hypothetical protein C8R47DRAFT_1080232 [Mycena vitilis]